jgi:hypothetical protein
MIHIFATLTKIVYFFFVNLAKEIQLFFIFCFVLFCLSFFFANLSVNGCMHSSLVTFIQKTEMFESGFFTFLNFKVSVFINRLYIIIKKTVELFSFFKFQVFIQQKCFMEVSVLFIVVIIDLKRLMKIPACL